MKMISFCIAVSVSVSCIGATEGVPDVLVQGKVVAQGPSLRELKDRFVGIIEMMYANKEPEYVFTKDQLYRKGFMLGKLHPDKGGRSNGFFDEWVKLMKSSEAPSDFTKAAALGWVKERAGGQSIEKLGGGLNRAISHSLSAIFLDGDYLWSLPHLNVYLMECFDGENLEGEGDLELLCSVKEARILVRRLHQKIKKEGLQNIWLGSLEKALDTFKKISDDIVVTKEEFDLPLLPVGAFQQGQHEFNKEDLVRLGGGVLGMSINGFYKGYSGTFPLECLADMLVVRNPRNEDEPYDEFECAGDMANYIWDLVKERGDGAKEVTEDEALEYLGTILADRYTKEWAAKPQKPVSDRFATPESIFLNVPLKKMLALHNEPYEHSTPTDDILSTSTESPHSLRDDVAADEPAVAPAPSTQNLIEIPAPAAIIAPDRDQDAVGAGFAHSASVVPESPQESLRKKKRQRKTQKQNHVVEPEPILESESVVEPVVKALTPPPVVRPVTPVAPVVHKKRSKQKRDKIVSTSTVVVPLEQSALVASPVLEPVVQVVRKTPSPVSPRITREPSPQRSPERLSPAKIDVLVADRTPSPVSVRVSTPVLTPLAAEPASPTPRASTPSEHRVVAAVADVPTVPVVVCPAPIESVMPKKSNAAKGFIAAGLASGALFYYVRKKEAEISRELLAVENNPKSSPEAITKLREQQRWLRRYKLLTLIPFLGGLGIGVVKSARG